MIRDLLPHLRSVKGQGRPVKGLDPLWSNEFGRAGLWSLPSQPDNINTWLQKTKICQANDYQMDLHSQSSWSFWSWLSDMRLSRDRWDDFTIQRLFGSSWTRLLLGIGKGHFPHHGNAAGHSMEFRKSRWKMSPIWPVVGCLNSDFKLRQWTKDIKSGIRHLLACSTSWSPGPFRRDFKA